jgi:hypothetical protein
VGSDEHREDKSQPAGAAQVMSQVYPGSLSDNEYRKIRLVIPMFLKEKRKMKAKIPSQDLQTQRTMSLAKGTQMAMKMGRNFLNHVLNMSVSPRAIYRKSNQLVLTTINSVRKTFTGFETQAQVRLMSMTRISAFPLTSTWLAVMLRSRHINLCASQFCADFQPQNFCPIIALKLWWPS